MTEPREGQRAKHRFVLLPDARISDDDDDVWPGDEVDVHDPNTGITFFMTMSGEGEYEWR